MTRLEELRKEREKMANARWNFMTDTIKKYQDAMAIFYRMEGKYSIGTTNTEFSGFHYVYLSEDDREKENKEREEFYNTNIKPIKQEYPYIHINEVPTEYDAKIDELDRLITIEKKRNQIKKLENQIKRLEKC